MVNIHFINASKHPNLLLLLILILAVTATDIHSIPLSNHIHHYHHIDLQNHFHFHFIHNTLINLVVIHQTILVVTIINIH